MEVASVHSDDNICGLPFAGSAAEIAARLDPPPDLALGFVYLGVLPSAVSSSIAYTAMAKGNVPAAVCNSAGSNVFGLLLTPLLMSMLIGLAASEAMDLGQTLADVPAASSALRPGPACPSLAGWTVAAQQPMVVGL